MSALNPQTFSLLTVMQLRVQLKQRGLGTGGLKQDLVERLIEYDNSGGQIATGSPPRKVPSTRRASSVNPTEITTTEPLQQEAKATARRRTVGGELLRSLAQAQDEEETSSSDQENASFWQTSQEPSIRKTPSQPIRSLSFQKVSTPVSENAPSDSVSDEPSQSIPEDAPASTSQVSADGERQSKAASHPDSNACPSVLEEDECSDLALSSPPAADADATAASAEDESEGWVSQLFWKLHSFQPETVVYSCGLILVLYILSSFWALSVAPDYPELASFGFPLLGFAVCVICTILLGVYDKWSLEAKERSGALSEFNELRIKTAELLISERRTLSHIISALEDRFHDQQEEHAADPHSIELAKSIRETTREIAESIHTLANVQALFTTITKSYDPKTSEVLRDIYTQLIDQDEWSN
ncbi:MAG: SAP domain-containing protein [archaeon]|nr:SAP domain-containing protein [archaeon]